VDYDGAIVNWTWVFDTDNDVDGYDDVLYGITVTYEYDSGDVGSHTVTLYVLDNSGMFGVITCSVNVQETPGTAGWVEATYRIDFVNMTTINVSAVFSVHKINNLTADDIRNASGGQVDSEIIKNIKLMINETFNDIINTTFKNDRVDKSEPITVNESTIIGGELGGDEYQPPINFTKNAAITFNVTSFGFKENSELKLDDVIRGTLKMGAVINKTFDLKAGAGYNNTFIFTFPEYIKIVSEDEDDSDEKATWTVDNKNATDISDSIPTTKSLTIESRSPNPVLEEEVLRNLIIDLYDFDELYLYGAIDIKSVNITKYNVSLPSNIKNLSYISSDGLRMALENNLVTWEDIENEINKTKKDAEKMLNNTFNTMITLNFTWYNKEDYNLSTRGSERPINATIITLNETNSPKIKPNLFGDFDAETITGILNAGAKYGFDISSSDQNYTLSMILPENMIFSGYSQKVEHTNITNRNAYSWSSSETLSCKLESGVAPEYNESRALLNVLIDMHNIDIFGMMLNMDLGVNAEIYCIKLSDVSMPKNLTMKYINSDCLRLLYDKGIIKQSDIDNITDEIKKGLEENLTTALGGNVSISVYIDYDSLKHYNVNNMSDVRPVSISAEARI
ncbi:MAG: hypothetical protein L6265_01420, partial [Thermoplasmatales archaeon]|nr:hypothetical protein [Thermoplasmatales archaeon]